LAARAATISATRVWEEARFPDASELDLVVLMGGPMSIHDTEAHGWLEAEKEFVGELLRSRARVLGICLGAQLLAEALGAAVEPAAEPEIGWFGIEAAEGSAAQPLVEALTRPRRVFHWHAEQFGLPPDAVGLARSDGCAHQAFRWGPRVLGLQFHLEMTPEGAEQLVEHCAEDLQGAGPWVQSPSEILARPERFAASHEALAQVLDQFLDTSASPEL
jgi:GMP synthase-like glutamine amidotransferase